MDIPTDLSGILSAFGAPAGAVALGYGLIRGADTLEKDARQESLRYISELLRERSFTSFGKLGVAVVPFVFKRFFGSNPLSSKFIIRSILASIVFWIALASMLILLERLESYLQTAYLDGCFLPLFC